MISSPFLWSMNYASTVEGFLHLHLNDGVIIDNHNFGHVKPSDGEILCVSSVIYMAWHEATKWNLGLPCITTRPLNKKSHYPRQG